MSIGLLEGKDNICFVQTRGAGRESRTRQDNIYEGEISLSDKSGPLGKMVNQCPIVGAAGGECC